MKNDTINTSNKIITQESLKRIFNCLNSLLKRYLKISEQEKKQNHMYETTYQNYTFKDEGSSVKVNVYFHDKTDITYDNFDNFISVFENRADEMKSIYLNYRLRYSVVTPEPNKSNNYYSQGIILDIRENNLNISYELSSEDPKLSEAYKLINEIVQKSHPKYDFVIRKRKTITNIVTFGIGLIPGIILATLTIFVPQLNEIVFKSYIMYPIFALLLAYLIGSIISRNILDSYYKPISPAKMYVGYNNKTYNSIYKDDIEEFTKNGEVLIGENTNNIKLRKKIKRYYLKYKSLLFKEIIVLIVMSLIVIIIGIYK